jgi:hypothetical protein
LGSLCTSNSTQGVIQLRAKCRRFGDCCWFCSCCWCFHVVDVSKEASRASRFSALKASWFSASGAMCRPTLHPSSSAKAPEPPSTPPRMKEAKSPLRLRQRSSQWSRSATERGRKPI